MLHDSAALAHLRFSGKEFHGPSTNHQLRSAIGSDCPLPTPIPRSHFFDRLAQVFDPSKAKGFTVGKLADCVNSLEALPCFSQFNLDLNSPQSRSPLLEGMGLEITEFHSTLKHVDARAFDRDDPTAFTAAVLEWWRCHARHIPNWAIAARIMFAISPSSAAAERVFSILANSFGSTRDSALEDLVEGTLQVRFNEKQRETESRSTLE